MSGDDVIFTTFQDSGIGGEDQDFCDKCGPVGGGVEAMRRTTADERIAAAFASMMKRVMESTDVPMPEPSDGGCMTGDAEGIDENTDESDVFVACRVAASADDFMAVPPNVIDTIKEYAVQQELVVANLPDATPGTSMRVPRDAVKIRQPFRRHALLRGHDGDAAHRPYVVWVVLEHDLSEWRVEVFPWSVITQRRVVVW